MRRSQVVYLVACMVISLLTGCIKEELPAPPHEPGDVNVSTVDMGEDYRWQIFYNLKNNQVVSKNLRNDWDLGFEASPDGYHVILNSARIMFAYNTGRTDFDAVKDTTGFGAKKTFDMPGGSLDSTAIGDWRKDKPVYIISSVGGAVYKVQLLGTIENGYSVRFASMDGQGDKTMDIVKDDQYNFMFLSIPKAGLVTVEPPKASWDVVFTNYTHMFYSMNMHYSVTGCLLNRYNTYAVMDSTVAFEAIDYTNAGSRQLSPAINTIGYDWKSYDFDKGYITYPKMQYIIRNSEGIYFKMRFVEFLANGIKGNPKFEYQQL